MNNPSIISRAVEYSGKRWLVLDSISGHFGVPAPAEATADLPVSQWTVAVIDGQSVTLIDQHGLAKIAARSDRPLAVAAFALPLFAPEKGARS